MYSIHKYFNNFSAKFAEICVLRLKTYKFVTHKNEFKGKMSSSVKRTAILFHIKVKMCDKLLVKIHSSHLCQCELLSVNGNTGGLSVSAETSQLQQL